MNKGKFIKLGHRGFTLIELLISMAIAGIVTAAIYAAFQAQQRSSVIQENVNQMQQNLRAAMEIVIKDVRMAGYGRPNISGVGILDVRPRNKDNVFDVTVDGNGAIQLSADFNDNGALNSEETIIYSIFDSPVGSPDGKPDLAGEVGGGGRQLLAEDIEALGFAFAFDGDGDGNIDTYDATGMVPLPADPEQRRRIIWAVDSNNDNQLDLNLDTNLDGVIDENDDGDNNGLIEGVALASTVDPADIRAVRIWMLARTDRPDDRFRNPETYVVGHKVSTPGDNYRRRLLETIVRCRNLEF
ncbi:MAG TPA: PilW family protein [Desulfobacteraceae bacterium]|nr:PilW family protein [Desulfobacteraceae bacterium]HPJ67694.1 PilW family protein [Desulfobacteraceae bacterium]HPQ29571.1 PilW family protein [Desulfobacteraceae bacterium]